MVACIPSIGGGLRAYFRSNLGGTLDPAKGFVEVWFDGEQVVPRAMTATLLDGNAAFLHIGLMRDTSEVPETIIIDHVIEATTLEEVTPQRLAEKRKPAVSK